MTPDRLIRFKIGAMMIGGCPLNENGTPVESPGWIGRAADVMEMDRGNLSKVLLGQRTLTDAIEDRLDASIREWRDREVKRIRTALLIAAQISTDRQNARNAQQLDDVAAELEDDGPSPRFGG